jgi:hypothetical protein
MAKRDRAIRSDLAEIAFLRAENERLSRRIAEIGAMVAPEQWATPHDDGGPGSVEAWRQWRAEAPHGADERRQGPPVAELVRAGWLPSESALHG